MSARARGNMRANAPLALKRGSCIVRRGDVLETRQAAQADPGVVDGGPQCGQWRRPDSSSLVSPCSETVSAARLAVRTLTDVDVAGIDPLERQ